MSAKDFSEVAELARRKTTGETEAFRRAVYLQNVLIGIAEVLNQRDRGKNYIASVARSVDSGSPPPGKPAYSVCDMLDIQSHVPVRRSRFFLGNDVARFVIRHDGIDDCTENHHYKTIVSLGLSGELGPAQLDTLYAAVWERVVEVLPSHRDKPGESRTPQPV